MAPKQRQPPGEPMTLGNMRELGVQNLLVSCLNPDCLHSALLGALSYSAETEINRHSTPHRWK